MSCDRWRDLLDAYADDRCSPEELAGLEAHLRTCAECASEALGRVQMKRATRAAAMRYAPSPEFRLRIEKAVQTSGKQAGMGSRLRLRGLLPVLGGALLALVLIVASMPMWTRRAERELAIAELTDLHVATLASPNPVDVVSTDRHTVKPWFAGKLPFAFNLPELGNTPFRLLGGKLVYLQHSAGAQLLYADGKHQLSVFIVPDERGVAGFAPGRIATIREKGFSVETWNAGGLRYSVIGDASPADVRALGELLRAAGGA